MRRISTTFENQVRQTINNSDTVLVINVYTCKHPLCGAVVVVKWLECSPSTLTIQVRSLLCFLSNLCLKRMKMKKEAEVGAFLTPTLLEVQQMLQ